MSDTFTRQRTIYLIYALKNDTFKELIIDYLTRCGDLDYRRFSKSWKRLIRVLLFHYAADPCPVPISHLSKALGDKLNVFVYLAIGCGWLTVEHRRCRITQKGVLLVEECFKVLERKYSTFWVEQEALEVAAGLRKRKRKRKVPCKSAVYVGLIRVSPKSSC